MKYFTLETVPVLLWKLCGRLVVDFCNGDRENKSLWNLLARIKCLDNLAIYLKRNIPKWRERGLGEVACLPRIRAFQRMIVDWWENARNPVQWCFNHLFSRISESSIAKIQGWTRGLATHMDFRTPCGVFFGMRTLLTSLWPFFAVRLEVCGRWVLTRHSPDKWTSQGCQWKWPSFMRVSLAVSCTGRLQ